ncbi:MAG: lysophospholipid acyltransferase family protein [Candidatus Omnitrophica bacterium]|nr:lysophospholipid acyltransferase family protein [Candidatus Omnitrophota bacterium]
MWYFIGWSFFLIFFKTYLGFRAVGRSNVPAKGAFIFVSNHSSYFDPILLGTSLRRALYYMARESLFHKPISNWAMKQVHAFPIKRERGDLGALRQALAILRDGKPLVMFPEGTRSKSAQLRSAKPGVGFIVAKARVPVIPAYIDGSLEALPGSLKTLKRHPVTVYIGEPIVFDFTGFGNSKEAYQQIADEIMNKIAALKDRYVSKAG